MNIAEALKNDIDKLQNEIKQIAEDDEYARAKEWHYFKLGSDYGNKLGQLRAYQEILELLESEKC